MRKILLFIAVTAGLMALSIAFSHNKAHANGAYAYSGGWAYPSGCPGGPGGLQTGFTAAVDNQNVVLPYGTNSYVGNLRLNTGICPFADYGTADNARFEWLFGGNPNISPYGLPTANFGTVGHALYTAIWGLTINTSSFATSPGWHEMGLIYRGCADYGFFSACTSDSSGVWAEIDFQFYISPAPAPVTPTVSTACSGTTSQLNISWGGSSTGTAGGFSVDVSAPNNSSHTANNYYSKSVGTATSTTAPSGFNLWPGGTPAMPALVPGATYYVWVWNGLSSAPRSIVARNCNPPPTVDLKIKGTNDGSPTDTPSAIYVGQSINLSWTSTNATGTCTTSGTSVPSWTGSKALNLAYPPGEDHSSDANTAGTKTYTLTCSGAGGQKSDTVSIIVNNPPPIPTCGGLTVTPSIPEPSQPFSLTWNFSLSPAASAATNYTVGYNIPGISPSSGTSPTLTMPIGGTSGGATFNGLTAPAGIYNGTFTVSGGISLSCPFGTGVPPTTNNPNPPPPITVASKPYLRTYGGDVLAGTDFNTGTCTSANSGIIGYNKGATGSFAGAGTQLATQASSTIVDFTSAALRAPPGNLLAFANTGAGVDPTYGGSFGSVPCVSDYSKFSGTDPGGTVGGAATVTGQTFAYNAIANSAHVVLKSSGNVTISGNIIYSGNGAWTSVAQIPSFYLIVEGGNIYIDKGVTQLDGVYVAQGGTIYTCSNANTPYAASDTTVAAGCTNQLVVNGALIANQVKFLRTKGTLNSAVSSDAGYPSPAANIAEVFNFSPELWLVNPGLSTPNYKFDSITSLPPVL